MARSHAIDLECLVDEVDLANYRAIQDVDSRRWKILAHFFVVDCPDVRRRIHLRDSTQNALQYLECPQRSNDFNLVTSVLAE